MFSHTGEDYYVIFNADIKRKRNFKDKKAGTLLPKGRFKATQGNVTAMIYYLKTRDRENWGENQPEPLKEIPPMQITVAPS
jgi:hypothetical protein